MMKLDFDETTLGFRLTFEQTSWETATGFRPSITVGETVIYFDEAVSVEHSYTPRAVRSSYTFTDYCFKTEIRLEGEDEVFFEWRPIKEVRAIDRVVWPGPLAFEEASNDWVSLLPIQQGLMIPNTWPEALGPISFDGLFLTAGATMPWFSQLKGDQAVLASCLTPWDAGYQADHPAGGPFTHVSFYMQKSLGAMRYPRVFRYTFFSGATLSDITARYRRYAEAEQKFLTLAEKAERLSGLDGLIGSMVVHTGIKTHIEPESRMYDPADPMANQVIRPYKHVSDYAEELAGYGLEKVYFHLDGWAEPGYDNQHPDYHEPVEAAGGLRQMKQMVETIQGLGYLFGIHDQYRDYYLRAPSFTWEKAVRLEDGSHPEHAFWAGGRQTYLCSHFALDYVKRNFSLMKDKGIVLDAAYLDVFTCNEADECFHPDHPVSRREGYANRLACFDYLRDEDILSSSEEMNEWALPSLVFCHYAPYDFMLRAPGSPKYGLPVPLFNLVYHDCAIIPWMMEQHAEEDYFLYALLNGGIPYLRRDGAYQNIDGSFETTRSIPMSEHIERCRVVSRLHERVAKERMIDFELLDASGKRQRSVFSDGTRVTIDLATGDYVIEPPLAK